MTEILLYKPTVIRNGFFTNYTTFSWSQSGTGTWTYEDGYAKHNNDGIATLTQNDVLFTGVTYRIKIKVASLTGGQTITVSAGGATNLINANGVYEFDLTASSTYFSIIASSTFNGTVSNITVKESPGSYALDVTQEVSIPITYSIDDLRDPATRSTNFSKTISLPGTKNNNKIFNQIYEISGDCIFNPNKQCGCVVLNNGIQVFKGVLSLDNINRINSSSTNKYDDISYDVTLIGTLGNIFNLWGDKTVAELDFSEYTHIFNRDNVYNSWYGVNIINGSSNPNYTVGTAYTISSIASVTFEGQDRVKVTFTGTHTFNIGDIVLGQCSNNLLSGHQTVVDITSTTITLLLLWSALTDTTNPTGTFFLFNFEGFGYVYPMIDTGTVNNTTHENDHLINSTLVIGKNYIIVDFVPGDNFTNVGASSNVNGVSFTATGTTPTTWSNGTTIAGTDIANWRVNEFQPAIFAKEILDKAFESVGYNYTSTFLNSNIFKRLIVPFSKGKDFKLSNQDIQPLLFKATMADTMSSPNGHTKEHKYALYPYASVSPYNQGVGLGAQYRFLSVNAIYSNYMYGTLGYDASGNPGGGGGFGIGADIFIKGVSYKIISKLGSDDFTNAGAPSNANGTIWTSTVSNNAAGAGVTWTGQSQIQVLDPMASHHLICQNPVGCTAVLVGEVPFNNEVYDYGNNYNNSTYAYTQPAGYPPVTHTFYFSGICWNYVKDFYAWNGISGDMPDDYAGTSAPGIYANPGVNGRYIGGIGSPTSTLPAAEESENPEWNPFNVIVFEKHDGVTWVPIKYLSAVNTTTGNYSRNRWEESTITGSCDITLNAGEKVRMRYRANTKIVAIRSDGHPCVGPSAYGPGGSGGVGTGNYGGPVQMTLRIDNAQFFNRIKQINIEEGFTVPYDFNTVLPNVKIADFFKSIIQGFNLLVDKDKLDDTLLNIETRDSYYNNSNTIDWTNKLDISKAIILAPMGDLNAKSYIYSYSQGNDYFNTDYDTVWGSLNDRTYGDKIVNVDNDFVNSTNKTELIFNPTPIVGPDEAYRDSDRVISAIYATDNNGVKKINSLNLLSYNIRGTDFAWNLISSVTSNKNNVSWNIFTPVFKFYPQAIHLDNHLTPNVDLNFGVPQATYYTPAVYTENNLYEVYHKKYIEEITDRNSKIVTAYFHLNPSDILTLDFSKLIFMDGHLLRLKKIYDYDVNNNGTTKCEFIKVKDK